MARANESGVCTFPYDGFSVRGYAYALKRMARAGWECDGGDDIDDVIALWDKDDPDKLWQWARHDGGFIYYHADREYHIAQEAADCFCVFARARMGEGYWQSEWTSHSTLAAAYKAAMALQAHLRDNPMDICATLWEWAKPGEPAHRQVEVDVDAMRAQMDGLRPGAAKASVGAV